MRVCQRFLAEFHEPRSLLVSKPEVQHAPDHSTIAESLVHLTDTLGSLSLY